MLRRKAEMEKLNKSHAKKQHEVTSIFIKRPMDRGKVRPTGRIGKTQHEDDLTSVTPSESCDGGF